MNENKDINDRLTNTIAPFNSSMKCLNNSVLIAFVFMPLLMASVQAWIAGMIYCSTSCDETSWLPLSMWLVIYGGNGLFFVIAFALFVYLVSYEGFSFSLLAVTLAFFLLFNIVWNAIGMVLLLRDGVECYTSETALWINVLVTMVVQWYTIMMSTCLTGVRN